MLVAAVPRQVAQLAVVLARGLALVPHQIGGDKGEIVVTKSLAKLTFGIAALAAATWVGTSSSRAYGDAPWCAVINIGTGTVYWDCQYPTFEACYHLGNILAGTRGFCNLNPSPAPYQRRHRY